MDKPKIEDAPGLKWRWRSRGWIPMWIPRADAVRAGYPAAVVPLEHLLDRPDAIADRCRELQGQMIDWLDGNRPDPNAYDGTIGSILRLYELDPESPFQALKPSSQHPYASYLKRLTKHIGARQVASVNSKDVKGWHRTWIGPDRARPHLAAGAMALVVLKEALTHFVGLRLSGKDEARELREILSKMRFPAPKARRAVATAADVIAARKRAHALGRPSLALAYAIQFETLLRQWDVIDELAWTHIDKDMILRFTPTKTARTTAAEVLIDLRVCPMVVEELGGERKQVGPVVVCEMTGRRWHHGTYQKYWRQIRKACGLPAELWNRDLRASGVTEARAGGGSNDDNAKVAGHSRAKTTAEVYDRERLEAQRRVAQARLEARQKAKGQI